MLDGSLEEEFDRNLWELTQLAFRVAYSVLRRREDAEEVAQEAMLTAYRKFRTLRNRDRFRSWLVRVTWRRALDRQRSDRRREKREQIVIASTPEPSPEELAVSSELRGYIWRAIDELPEAHRKTVILSAIEGHDTRSVARLLGLPAGTVKSRLHNARKILLEKLKWIASESGIS